MKRQIEIFTAGCPVCEPVVAWVTETACKNCQITIYDLSVQSGHSDGMAKMKAYGLKRLPAVAVDGKPLSCCKKDAITKEDLIKAGIGIC